MNLKACHVVNNLSIIVKKNIISDFIPWRGGNQSNREEVSSAVCLLYCEEKKSQSVVSQSVVSQQVQKFELAVRYVRQRTKLSELKHMGAFEPPF